MLPARAHGPHTCRQEAWAVWHRVIRDYRKVPVHEMIFCGMALGYAGETAAVSAARAFRPERFTASSTPGSLNTVSHARVLCEWKTLIKPYPLLNSVKPSIPTRSRAFSSWIKAHSASLSHWRSASSW
jgi:hypothetical protein